MDFSISLGLAAQTHVFQRLVSSGDVGFMTRIGIVGGGPGGLFAASMLEEFCAGMCEVTVFEAGPRVGGKIFTSRFESAPVLYEAGVAELYDYSHFGPDPVKQLITKKLGLDVVRMTGPTVVLG